MVNGKWEDTRVQPVIPSRKTGSGIPCKLLGLLLGITKGFLVVPILGTPRNDTSICRK